MIRRMCVVAIALMLTACAHQDAARRIDYWRSEIDRYLPAGPSMEVADAFFAQRGLRLVCCVNNGTGLKHYAVERDVAQSVFTYYDVAILVNMTADNHVSKVTVEQWALAFDVIILPGRLMLEVGLQCSGAACRDGLWLFRIGKVLCWPEDPITDRPEADGWASSQ